ncbi:AraC family transcriptional regulator [Pandoraea apista]|uniref:AraC family transcriptional regulator n=1 Tax=Pandoraea apista TaxID=93218 RepID=UPI000658002C|nr:AraC family transcriptional regulator [Pandoraea apista]AVF40587.1 AraC family transcriptional regulator [Pandoraea apista]RRW98770.1 AraC family transcriptional regulator [Pandoraea apista]RRX05397.1 AraC family transcriptional regulator [Pandoraea apista]CFB63655.1 HTH-type transcriptional activator RhaR [Pandoraea apista]
MRDETQSGRIEAKRQENPGDPSHPGHPDRVADWLLAGLELKSTLFHVGEYCGVYQASTAGHQRASFHVVLDGGCYLHLGAEGGQAARTIALSAGDAVFLLSDVPHCLSPNAAPPSDMSARTGKMAPLPPQPRAHATDSSSVSLACGFFEFRTDLDALVLGMLPNPIVARRASGRVEGMTQVFALIQAEARRPGEAPSPLLARLTDLLFYYALREAVHAEDVAPGMWRLMRRDAFGRLAAAIIESPGERWTTDAMAEFVHMSRARFCKQFAEIGGQPPAQFVTLVRMKTAAALLRAGVSLPDAAEQVGYQSESAFSQAFKRVTGIQPGAWRRQATHHAAPDTAPARAAHATAAPYSPYPLH